MPYVQPHLVELAELVAKGDKDPFELVVAVLGEYNREHTEVEDKYLKAAQDNARDGELEIDDNTIVSVSEDPGAYVMAWVWVSAEQAGVEVLEDAEAKELDL